MKSAAIFEQLQFFCTIFNAIGESFGCSYEHFGLFGRDQKDQKQQTIFLEPS